MILIRATATACRAGTMYAALDASAHSFLAHSRRCSLMAYFNVYSMSLRSTLNTSHTHIAWLDLTIFQGEHGPTSIIPPRICTSAPAYSNPPLLLVCFL